MFRAEVSRLDSELLTRLIESYAQARSAGLEAGRGVRNSPIARTNPEDPVAAIVADKEVHRAALAREVDRVFHAVSELVAADEALRRLAGWPRQHFTKVHGYRGSYRRLGGRYLKTRVQ